MSLGRRGTQDHQSVLRFSVKIVSCKRALSLNLLLLRVLSLSFMCGIGRVLHVYAYSDLWHLPRSPPLMALLWTFVCWSALINRMMLTMYIHTHILLLLMYMYYFVEFLLFRSNARIFVFLSEV